MPLSKAMTSKAGVLQRLDQEAAHVVVVFGEEDLVHGGPSGRGHWSAPQAPVVSEAIASISVSGGKYRVKTKPDHGAFTVWTSWRATAAFPHWPWTIADYGQYILKAAGGDPSMIDRHAQPL